MSNLQLNNEKEEIDKELNEKNKEEENQKLEEQSHKTIKEIHKKMTLLRYKYEFYSTTNILVNLFIILCSSIITFLESLRANLPSDDVINFWFTITTLSLGFLIALSVSISKFIKLQDKLEFIKSGINALTTPYNNMCEFQHSIKKNKEKPCNSCIMNGDIQVKNFPSEWEQIQIKSVYPIQHADDIIHSCQLYNYEKRYIDQDNKIILMRQRKSLEKMAHENLIIAKDTLLHDMLETTEKIKVKYGTYDQWKDDNKEKELYWKECVIISDKLEKEYNNVLGINDFTKCWSSYIDLCCPNICGCQIWWKKLGEVVNNIIKCMRLKLKYNKKNRKNDKEIEKEEMYDEEI